jgi:hypothetical protein
MGLAADRPWTAATGLYLATALPSDVTGVRTRFTVAGATTNPSILLAPEAGQQLGHLAVVRALAAHELPALMAQPIGETKEALYTAAER